MLVSKEKRKKKKTHLGHETCLEPLNDSKNCRLHCFFGLVATGTPSLLWHVEVVMVVGVTRYFISIIKNGKTKKKKKNIPRGSRHVTSQALAIDSTALVLCCCNCHRWHSSSFLSSSPHHSQWAVLELCNRYEHLKAQTTVYTVVWAFSGHNTLKISELLSKASKN